MQNKEELVSAIKEYLVVDNEIKSLCAQLSLQRRKKVALSRTLTTTMRDHQIDKFEIQGGSIVYDRRQVKKTLTQKLLVDLIGKFFRDDTASAAAFTTFINENRGETVRENVVRKQSKAQDMTGAPSTGKKYAALNTAIDRAQREASAAAGWENMED